MLATVFLSDTNPLCDECYEMKKYDIPQVEYNTSPVMGSTNTAISASVTGVDTTTTAQPYNPYF